MSLIGIQIMALLSIGLNYDLNPTKNDLLESFASLSWLHYFSKHGLNETLQGDDFIGIPSVFHEGTPIDNYYARAHLKEKVPIIVGGSDGSGTRVFVDALKKLGVSMIIDDEGSMDFHSQTSFQGQGWPPFAKHALKHCSNRSLVYDPTSFPSQVLDEIRGEMNQIHDRLSRRAENLNVEAMKTPASKLPPARYVSYGFKAPITIVLLPLIAKYLFPDTGFKFLHVVRDGRDVALSKNQSPVKKFYRVMYGDATTSNNIMKYNSTTPVLAMQLWNDWNIGAYEWEKQEALSNEKFDFLVMRSEDLLNPNSKAGALKQLADFVGSAITDEELCCQSKYVTSDMGTSSAGGKFGHGMPDLMRTKEILYKKLQQGQFTKNFAKTIGKEIFGGEKLPKLKEKGKDHDAMPIAMEKQNFVHLSEERRHRFLERLMQHKADRNILQKRRLLENSDISFQSYLYDNNTPQPVDNGKWYGNREESPRNDHFSPKRRRRLLTSDNNYIDNVLGNMLDDQLEQLKVANEGSKFSGKSSSISRRYGKWKSMLSNHAQLSKRMHEEGARALRCFGYEPPRQFMDKLSPGITCDKKFACL